MTEKCPKCGANATILVPLVWACGRASATVGMDSITCLVRQLAQAKEENERLRGLVEEAFREGMIEGGQGEYTYTSEQMVEAWKESDTRKEIK